MLGSRLVDGTALQPDDVVSGVYRDGYLRANGQTVNAPWFTVRVRGRRAYVSGHVALDADGRGKLLETFAHRFRISK